MRLILTFCVMMIFCTTQAQQQAAKITSTHDSRLPQEVRDKLAAIKSPEDLRNFRFESKSTETLRDTGLTAAATIKTIRSFNFSNGQIVGEIRVTRSIVGYSSETTTTPVELCYQYCCTDKNGVEHCTQNFDVYKQWMKHPENCLNGRTTACQ